MSNIIIITWLRNGMTLVTKWYGSKWFDYEMAGVIRLDRPRQDP